MRTHFETTPLALAIALQKHVNKAPNESKVISSSVRGEYTRDVAKFNFQCLMQCKCYANAMQLIILGQLMCQDKSWEKGAWLLLAMFGHTSIAFIKENLFIYSIKMICTKSQCQPHSNPKSRWHHAQAMRQSSTHTTPSETIYSLPFLLLLFTFSRFSSFFYPPPYAH